MSALPDNHPTSPAFLGLIPPHNEDAERAVLGAALLWPEVIDDLVELLRPEDFYVCANETIAATILSLHARHQAVDLITLSEDLRRRNELERVGGVGYLSKLLDGVIMRGGVEAHAQIVSSLALKRSVISACVGGVERGYHGEEDGEELCSQVAASLDAASSKKTRSRLVGIAAALQATTAKIEQEIKSPRALTGVSSGFFDMDAITQGLQASDLIILAGRPSMGKTALALNIAVNAAKHELDFVHEVSGEQPRGVLIFSLEMSTDKLTRRMIAMESRVPSWKLMNPKHLGEADFNLQLNASERLHRLPIYIDDSDSLNVRDLVVRARRLNRKHRLMMIIVDYLQIMKALERKGDRPNRDRELGEITGALKGLAKELGVPVLLLSQLNRANESRQDKRPQLQDLRESGAIEQDADVVMFVHREAYYDTKASRDAAEVIFRKHRNGPLGTVMLAWDEHLTLFANTTEAEAKAMKDVQRSFGWNP